MPQLRYQKIVDLVGEVKPATIVEIGVYNGERAKLMSAEALRYRPRVKYKGYDLFEDASLETDAAEFNAKRNHSVAIVSARLEAFKKEHRGFSYKLIKGNTNDTLKGIHLKPDFAFIDGGHSVLTIYNDYEAVRDSGFVLFDDYYLPNATGQCPDTKLFGANEVVDEMMGLHGYDVKIINTHDMVAGGGYVCLASVKRLG